MAGIALDGAKTTGHDQFPPTTCIASSSTVAINGKKVLLHGDPIVPHTRLVKPFDTHGGTCIASTGTVFINGKAVVRMGDGVTCGDTVADSSSNVFAG